MSQIPSSQSLLRRYFTDLRMQNWSPRTIDRRSYSLGRFLDWCSDRGIDSVAEITAEAIEAYRRSLFHYRNPKTGKSLKFATQASYLTALRHWLSWLSEQRWIAANPAAEIKLPKEEHRLPSVHFIPKLRRGWGHRLGLSTSLPLSYIKARDGCLRGTKKATYLLPTV